jgi:ribonuclease R
MPASLPSRSDIVRCLTDAGAPLHPREIASRCGVAGGSYSRLLELLNELGSEGAIRRMPGKRFAAAAKRGGGESWEGFLSLNPRGFGFVTAAGQEDLYIAPDAIGGAMHGDRVVATVINRTARGAEGRIDKIVARRNSRVAGVLRRRGRSTWLEPDDTRIRGPVVIVGGSRDGKDGDAAVVNITRFPSVLGENPEGDLVAVLGVPGDPNVEVAKILVRDQIAEQHPEAAVREAEAMAAKLQRIALEGRTDLRDVPLPTIDPEDARDHDDAVWVERRGEGYRAWIAIADVSEYVQLGSALDAEARNRGCTIYLPDRAIPMLPAALAADLCSLLPEQERLCLCVIADFDREGSVTGVDIVEGVMRSAAMLTYGGVARALGFTEQGPRSAQAEAMKKDLRVVDELARKLRKKRMRRGALDLDLPEAKVVLDPNTGAPVDVQRRAQDPGVKRAYQMIEELMLIANELVAKWLTKRKAPAIYRVHGKPDEQKLDRLGEIAKKLGAPFEQDQMQDPLGVNRWLRRIAEHPRRQVLEMMLLRSLKQAVYDITNIGHFGLASENYLHFTSPIRRYPDMLVHRSVKHLLRGGKPDTSASAIETLRMDATTSSVRERAAMDVEREVVDLHRALLMRERVGDVFEGTVTAITGGGVYVTLDHPFVDALVRWEALGPDRYEPTEDELGAVGARSGDKVELGDRVVLTIEDVAVLRRATYGRRVPPETALRSFERDKRGGRRNGKKQEPRTNPGRMSRKPPGRGARPRKKNKREGRRR